MTNEKSESETISLRDILIWFAKFSFLNYKPEKESEKPQEAWC